MTEPSAATPSPDPTPENPEIVAADVAEDGAEDPELVGLQAELLSLQAQGQNGANWFYWVAGLSLVNSVISLVGGDVSFVIGLGVTGISDAMASHLATERPELATTAKIVAFGFSLLASAVVAMFGWLSNKRWIPIFAMGMLLYLLDGLLYVLLQQWMCVAFHAFALFQMWQGLLAYRKMSAILRTVPAVT